MPHFFEKQKLGENYLVREHGTMEKSWTLETDSLAFNLCSILFIAYFVILWETLVVLFSLIYGIMVSKGLVQLGVKN